MGSSHSILSNCNICFVLKVLGFKEHECSQFGFSQCIQRDTLYLDLIPGRDDLLTGP